MRACPRASHAVSVMMNALRSSSWNRQQCGNARSLSSTRHLAGYRVVASVHLGLFSPCSGATSSVSSASTTGLSNTIRNYGKQGRGRRREFGEKVMVVMKENSISRLFNGQRALMRWTLSCGHSIICDCPHFVGMNLYCSRCNTWQIVRQWSKHDPSAKPPEESDPDTARADT